MKINSRRTSNNLCERASCCDNDDDNSSTTTERCAHDNYVVRDELHEVRNMRVILRFNAQTKGNEFRYVITATVYTAQ